MHKIKTKQELAAEIAEVIKGLLGEIKSHQDQINACRDLESRLFAKAAGEGIYDDVLNILAGA